ncbi:probable ATP-dependent RNA helicase DDX52 isoform X2 [Diadema setosum]|uniref:probable ATP-dependent RNA helicase DDX52 isoform X2 n=1 Tax=Diadema setosum TaxID=31175 RepID=UPI003B3AA0BB
MATAMSLFRQLGAGAKFDLKRFRSDAEKFHLVRASSKQLPQQDIVKALDIFGQDKEGQSSQKLAEEPHGEKRKADDVQQERDKKKRKKQKAQEKIPETSDGEEKLSEEKVKQRRVEKVKSIRKRNRIYVQGEDIPDPVESFEELSSEYQLDPYVINNITRAGYESPTPVQMQAVPVMMHRRELLACAPTGSGKTAAFLLPVMHHLKGPKKKGFRAVIVSPTRELAQQTYRELMRLSEGSGLRIHTIEHGAKAMQKFGPKTAQKFDILVTTPNRLVYLLQQDPPAINLSNVEWLIVDESDKLFEEGKTGFRDQLGTIYQACDSSHVRRAMFSATFAYDVEQWCRLNLDNVVTVSVGARNTANEQIEQDLTFVGGEYGKLLAVRDIFSKGFTPPVLVFVQSKERAKELFQELIYDGYNVDVIHADKTQTQGNDEEEDEEEESQAFWRRSTHVRDGEGCGRRTCKRKDKVCTKRYHPSNNKTQRHKCYSKQKRQRIKEGEEEKEEDVKDASYVRKVEIVFTYDMNAVYVIGPCACIGLITEGREILGGTTCHTF